MINSDVFEALEFENSKLGPVLVDFWSRKAGPSIRLCPVLDKNHISSRAVFTG